MALARGLANQASAVVHNARVYRDLEERNVELVARARRERLLNELSLELGSSLDRRHGARLGLPRHRRAAGRQHLRHLRAARRRRRRVPRRRGSTGRPSRTPSAGGCPLEQWTANRVGVRARGDRGRGLPRRPAPGSGRASGHEELGPALSPRGAHARARPHPRNGGDDAAGGGAAVQRRGRRDRRGVRAHDGAVRRQRPALRAAGGPRPPRDVVARGRPRDHFVAGHRRRPVGARAHGRDVTRLSRRRSSSSTTPRPTP